MTKHSPRARLSGRVFVRLVIFQGVCALVAVAIAGLVSLEASVSAFVGALAVAIPNAVVASVMNALKSPLRIVMLMLAKLGLCSVCLANAIVWFAPVPLPFFLSAAAVMILPSVMAINTQTWDKALLKR